MSVHALFCFLNEVEPSKAAFFLEPTEIHLKLGKSQVRKINQLFNHLLFLFVL